jgi:hypothetical protein
MARYVFMRSDLTLESIEPQMERELSPAFCRSLLARIGVHELPRAEFPADAVLRGFLSADVLTDLQSRVALHALAAPWVLPTDSVADMAAARHAWEVVSWSPFPVAEPGFWSLSGTQPTLEKDAIALQMDSLQIESLQKRGRDFSAQQVGDGLRELRRLRASVGDTASVRLLRAPTEGDLEIFHALSAPSFLAALPATLEGPTLHSPFAGGYYPQGTHWRAVARQVTPGWRMPLRGFGPRPPRSGCGNGRWSSASGGGRGMDGTAEVWRTDAPWAGGARPTPTDLRRMGIKNGHMIARVQRALESAAAAEGETEQ